MTDDVSPDLNPPEQYQRWYDHDPLLVKALDFLRMYRVELHSQAEVFLKKIENEVGEATVAAFYKRLISERPEGFIGRRWYDEDPTIAKAVEFLRVAPPELQHKIAESFLENLKAQGIEVP